MRAYTAAKTCANTKVTCGSGFSLKPGSTSCTTCANDGTECCIRTFFFCLFDFIPMRCLLAGINNMFAHARQPRHARTKMEPIPKSRAGPGSHQNLVPRLARLAVIMGLNAALVRSLICLFIYGFVLAMTTKCCFLFTATCLHLSIWQAR